MAFRRLSNTISLKDLLEMLPRRISPNGTVLLRLARALDEQGMTKEADRITQAMVRTAQPMPSNLMAPGAAERLRAERSLQENIDARDFQANQGAVPVPGGAPMWSPTMPMTSPGFGGGQAWSTNPQYYGADLGAASSGWGLGGVTVPEGATSAPGSMGEGWNNIMGMTGTYANQYNINRARQPQGYSDQFGYHFGPRTPGQSMWDVSSSAMRSATDPATGEIDRPYLDAYLRERTGGGSGKETPSQAASSYRTGNQVGPTGGPNNPFATYMRTENLQDPRAEAYLSNPMNWEAGSPQLSGSMGLLMGQGRAQGTGMTPQQQQAYAKNARGGQFVSPFPSTTTRPALPAGQTQFPGGYGIQPQGWGTTKAIPAGTIPTFPSNPRDQVGMVPSKPITPATPATPAKPNRVYMKPTSKTKFRRMRRAARYGPGNVRMGAANPGSNWWDKTFQNPDYGANSYYDTSAADEGRRADIGARAGTDMGSQIQNMMYQDNLQKQYQQNVNNYNQALRSGNQQLAAQIMQQQQQVFRRMDGRSFNNITQYYSTGAGSPEAQAKAQAAQQAQQTQRRTDRAAEDAYALQAVQQSMANTTPQAQVAQTTATEGFDRMVAPPPASPGFQGMAAAMMGQAAPATTTSPAPVTAPAVPAATMRTWNAPYRAPTVPAAAMRTQSPTYRPPAPVVPQAAMPNQAGAQAGAPAGAPVAGFAKNKGTYGA